MRFICANLADWIREHPDPKRFDIVLCLGIIHKLRDPAVPLAWAAASCSDLLCFRAPAKATNWVVQSKFSDKAVNVPKAMRAAGFADEGIVWGARKEGVQNWRRKR